MSSTMAARRYSMGPLPDPGLRRPGPALRRRRLPMAAIGFSTVGHIVVFGGLTAFVMWSGWRPEKVQVVNLVPMVAAVGVPVVLGARGAERVIEIKLTAAEQAAFDKSAGAVRELVEKLPA